MQIYSPWFPRRADNLIATLDLIVAKTSELLVFAFTKNLSDRGNGTVVDVGTLITLSSPGRAQVEWGPDTGIGLKELVRYKFVCHPQTVVVPNPCAVFRMLSPVWFDTVRGPS
jgi:hypothetical protein